MRNLRTNVCVCYTSVQTRTVEQYIIFKIKVLPKVLTTTNIKYCSTA